MREGMGGWLWDNYLLYSANYGIYYILIGNFLLPQAESPSGRYRRKLSQKQAAMEEPGCPLVCGGTTGVPIVHWSWGGCSDKPWSFASLLWKKVVLYWLRENWALSEGICSRSFPGITTTVTVWNVGIVCAWTWSFIKASQTKSFSRYI